MQNTRYENPGIVLTVEHDMPAAGHAPQAMPDFIARLAKVRQLGQLCAASFQLVNITDRLVRSPFAEGVTGNLDQIVGRKV